MQHTSPEERVVEMSITMKVSGAHTELKLGSLFGEHE